MIYRNIYMQQICNFIDKPVVKVITGMRRSGKSALLELTYQELIKRGIQENSIIRINFESLKYISLKDSNSLYEYILSVTANITGKLYFLFDEIQEVAQWQLVINSLRVDFNCDIYITGSNAKLLSGELATHLSGRYIQIKVFPLNFNEYLDFAKLNNNNLSLSEEKHFANYIKFGGLPGIHHMIFQEDVIFQYLRDIYNSVILNDVIEHNKIRDTALLNNIVLYIMDNIGNIFSAKKISDFIKSQGRKLSVETVYNYLRALESAYLIQKVSRFDIKGKRLLETQEKYYLTDLGLRNAALGFNYNDIAGMLENIVFLELKRRGYAVTIGKLDTTEVNFIANKNDNRIYVQICYILTEDNAEREFSPLENINDNYEKIVICSNSLLPYTNKNGIKVQNIVDFLNC